MPHAIFIRAHNYGSNLCPLHTYGRWSLATCIGQPARLKHFEHHATSVLVGQCRSLATNDHKYVMGISIAIINHHHINYLEIMNLISQFTIRVLGETKILQLYTLTNPEFHAHFPHAKVYSLYQKQSWENLELSWHEHTTFRWAPKTPPCGWPVTTAGSFPPVLPISGWATVVAPYKTCVPTSSPLGCLPSCLPFCTSGGRGCKDYEAARVILELKLHYSDYTIQNNTVWACAQQRRWWDDVSIGNSRSQWYVLICDVVCVSLRLMETYASHIHNWFILLALYT